MIRDTTEELWEPSYTGESGRASQRRWELRWILKDALEFIKKKKGQGHSQKWEQYVQRHVCLKGHRVLQHPKNFSPNEADCKAGEAGSAWEGHRGPIHYGGPHQGVPICSQGYKGPQRSLSRKSHYKSQSHLGAGYLEWGQFVGRELCCTQQDTGAELRPELT